MGRRLRRHPKAVSDVEEAAVYNGLENPEAAARFIDALEETLRLLAQNPQMGSARSFGRSELAGLRAFPVKGFSKHLVFYRSTGHGIEVLRVLHGARDLGTLFEEQIDG